MTYELAKQSRQHRYIELLKIKESNPEWLASSAGYQSIHQWLKRNYGNPSICSMCWEKGQREKGGRWSIQWALKAGYNHSHNKDHYIPLCRSCHRKYDMTPEELCRLKALAGNQTPEQLAKLSAKRRVIALERTRDENGHFTSTRT